MTESLPSFQLGAATVTIVDVGELLYRLADWLIVPASERTDELTRPLRFPTQCVHIRSPGASTLVDAGAYLVAPDSPHAVPGYQPPPGLGEALAAAGIAPESIDQVIITHGHHDHINGLTRERDGQPAPCFPNARHYFGRADWDQAQAALQNPGSVESRTLGALHRAGLLELTEGRRDLGGGVAIIAAPGESPGHQIVRVDLEGRVLYCVGDIYHHPLEIEHPDWVAQWAEPAASRASRRALAEAALAEEALLVATHIAGVGRLRRAGGGCAWEPA